jgi:hypothetical protein
VAELLKTYPVSADVDRRPAWVRLMDEPEAFKRRQLILERIKETGRLTELYTQQALLPGRIAMAKRHIDALNKQLRELGE